MNNTNLIGNLTKDTHFIPGTEKKSSVAYMTVANNDDKDSTVFVEVTVFGKTADYVNKNLKKGSRVAIEGKLAQRPKKTKNGDSYIEMYVIGKRLSNLSKTAGETQEA